MHPNSYQEGFTSAPLREQGMLGKDKSRSYASVDDTQDWS
jgi:hypothetical protein